MCCLVFVFKQKTAYEMLRSLVGSEMCIRDSDQPHFEWAEFYDWPAPRQALLDAGMSFPGVNCVPVSYTHLTLPTIYSV